MSREYRNPNDYWYYRHNDDPNYEWSMRSCLYSLVGIIVIVILSLLFSSCKSIQYVPVETVRTEYVTKTDTFTVKDSLVLHDSVYIHSKGDTVWYEKWHTKYKDRIVTKIVVDSFIKTDSIQVPYPVEKKLTRWQQFKVDWGGTIFIWAGVAIVLLIALIVNIIKRR